MLCQRKGIHNVQLISTILTWNTYRRNTPKYSFIYIIRTWCYTQRHWWSINKTDPL